MCNDASEPHARRDSICRASYREKVCVCVCERERERVSHAPTARGLFLGRQADLMHTLVAVQNMPWSVRVGSHGCEGGVPRGVRVGSHGV